MNPKPMLALVAALLLVGIGLRAFLGSGGAQREAPVPGGVTSRDALEFIGAASSEAEGQMGELRGATSGARAEVRSDPAATPTPVPTGPEWWAHAVDGETEKPLTQASFVVARAQLDDQAVFARAASDGHFVAPLATWNEEVVAVRAPGYATVYAVASGVHRARRAPQRVVLWRAATLTLGVMGTDAPLVTVSTPDNKFLQAVGATFVTWKDFLWEGHGRADGTTLFDELPARVPLTLEAVSPSGGAHRRELVLEPGERLELLWPIGGQSILTGLALDPAGLPVAELELWILAGELGRRNLTPEDGRLAFAETRTDPDGSFSFVGLVPGRYLVGPAPRGKTYVPLATAITLAGLDGGVVLPCWPGVEIRGHVRVPDGPPAAEAVVTAIAPGLSFSATVRSDGSFTLGTLAPGPYEVLARDAERVSAPVTAMGGDKGVELALPAPDATPR